MGRGSGALKGLTQHRTFLFFLFVHTSTFQLLDKKPWSQVSPLLPPGSCLQFLSRIRFSNPTARRLFIELLTHALALSASQFVRKKKSPRIYTSTHSGGFELTKLAYARVEDNLIRHRGDWLFYIYNTECHSCSAILTFLTPKATPKASPKATPKATVFGQRVTLSAHSTGYEPRKKAMAHLPFTRYNNSWYTHFFKDDLKTLLAPHSRCGE